MEQTSGLGLTMLGCNDGHVRQQPRYVPVSANPADGIVAAPKLEPPTPTMKGGKPIVAVKTLSLAPRPWTPPPRPVFVPATDVLAKVIEPPPAPQPDGSRATKRRCEGCGGGLYGRAYQRCAKCRADQKHTGRYAKFQKKCGCGRPLRMPRNGVAMDTCYRCRMRKGT